MHFFIEVVFFVMRVFNFCQLVLFWINTLLFFLKAKLAALKTAVKSAPDFVLPLLAERVQRTFDSEEIRDVTKKEVEIMNTPKGELWNIEIIDRYHLNYLNKSKRKTT